MGPVARGGRELLVGLALGRTGLGWLDPSAPIFAFLAQIGFALVMFVAGTHVPMRDASLRPALLRGVARAAVVAAVAIPAGWGIARFFGTGHAWLYAVLLASSSAALALPVLQRRTSDRPGLELIVQLAVEDTLCIVALPLSLQPESAGRAGLGALAVLAAGGLLYLVLAWGERSGYRRRVHKVSEDNRLAVEIRVVLVALFALCALALATGLSVMLGGFVVGLVVSAVGEPRRVARQVFAITEGFFAPVFFIWFGSQLMLRHVDLEAVWLGLALGAGALVCHLVPGLLTRQPAAMAALAAAQLGVPIAAMTDAGASESSGRVRTVPC
ncbi:cation:proton antiporter [Ammonicoccus fulvus]|uniref:Cation:proton antiporter n=1 Tax=Ammonicoccus fulvus TaxID=3138240 RepID=A0ABZ3FPN0_9ACTN